jgi:hypothetical protein
VINGGIEVTTVLFIAAGARSTMQKDNRNAAFVAALLNVYLMKRTPVKVLLIKWLNFGIK